MGFRVSLHKPVDSRRQVTSLEPGPALNMGVYAESRRLPAAVLFYLPSRSFVVPSTLAVLVLSLRRRAPHSYDLI